MIDFIYQNIIFKTFRMEIYQKSSLHLFFALYHLTHENENDIKEKLNIDHNEPLDQIAKLATNQISNSNLI